jgi:hypothetical protein
MKIVDHQKAADIARAFEIFQLLELSGQYAAERDELLGILRRAIAGLPPQAADAAITELFREIQIADDVWWES